MIKELVYFITLQSRTRRSLRQCAEIIDKNINEVPSILETIENYIKNGEIHLAVDFLNEKGVKLKVSESVLWSNLYIVARDHKMRDRIILLSRKLSDTE